MNWLYIAIIAHVLAGLVHVLDKLVLSKRAFSPFSYSFYVGILGAWALILAPLGFYLIPASQLAIAFSAGFLFVLGNLFFYQSISDSEVSKIAPIIGGAVPCFSLILTYILLEQERLTNKEFLVFFLLVLGGVIMLWPKDMLKAIQKGLPKKIGIALLSALCFSASFIFTKYIYYRQPFVNGFIWVRLGGALGASLLLLWPRVYREIIKASQLLKEQPKTIGLPVFNKALSAVAFMLLSYAIFLGNVSLINALQGVQYAFVLALALVLARRFPHIIKEKLEKDLIFQRIIAIIFISLGLAVLALW